MFPMECGNSKRQTMVLFRGCLIWTGEGITKKIGIDRMEELQFHQGLWMFMVDISI